MRRLESMRGRGCDARWRSGHVSVCRRNSLACRRGSFHQACLPLPLPLRHLLEINVPAIAAKHGVHSCLVFGWQAAGSDSICLVSIVVASICVEARRHRPSQLVLAMVMLAMMPLKLLLSMPSLFGGGVLKRRARMFLLCSWTFLQPFWRWRQLGRFAVFGEDLAHGLHEVPEAVRDSDFAQGPMVWPRVLCSSNPRGGHR